MPAHELQQQPVVLESEVVPSHAGPRTGPRVNVLVSLNFPDMNGHVADLVRRFTRVALEELRRARLRLAPGRHLGAAAAAARGARHRRAARAGRRRHRLRALRRARPGAERVRRRPRGRPVLDGCDPRGGRGATCRCSPCAAARSCSTSPSAAAIVPDLDPWHLHKGDYASGPLHRRARDGRRGHPARCHPRARASGSCARATTRRSPTSRRRCVGPPSRTTAWSRRSSTPTTWAVGVQWHPEDDDGHGHDRVLLWTALRQAAIVRAADRAGTLTD